MPNDLPTLTQAARVLFADQPISDYHAHLLNLDEEVLRRMFRKQAVRFHPDRCVTLGLSREVLEEDFKQINEAYQILNNAMVNGNIRIETATVVRQGKRKPPSTARKPWAKRSDPSQRRHSAGHPHAKKKSDTTRQSSGAEARSDQGADGKNRNRSHADTPKDPPRGKASSGAGQTRTTHQKQNQAAGGGRTQTGAQRPKYQHAHTRQPRSARTIKGFFYSGRIPERKLRFAEYLFYSGRINWSHLISSIVWQRSIRPRFGEIAAEFGYLNAAQIARIQTTRRQHESFGETALRLGYLDRRQLYMILGKQRLYRQPIGLYFLEMRMISQTMLDAWLAEHRKHNYAAAGKQRTQH